MMLALALAFVAAVDVPPPAADPAPAPPPRPFIAPATIDDGLEITGTEIGARVMATRLAIPVRINGSGPYRFVVDSGADRSVIGAGIAAQLALPPGRALTLHSMSGSGPATSVRIDRLEIGDSAIEDVDAPALSEADLGAQGLVGIDALAGQRLMLDFEKRSIRLQDPDAPDPTASTDDIVVVAKRRHGQLILTSATIGNIRVSAVIDTGTQVTIGNPALQARLLRGRRPPASEPVPLISVTGQTIMATLTIVPEMRIGGLLMRDVPIAFADAPPFKLFGLADEPAMMLGSDLLETFRRVSLDFKRKRVRFTLPRGARAG